MFRVAEEIGGQQAAVDFYERVMGSNAVGIDLFFDTTLLSQEGKAELEEIWQDTLGTDVDTFTSQWRSFVQAGG